MSPFQKLKTRTAAFAQRISWKTHLPWCAALLLIVLALFGKYLISTTEAISVSGGSVYSYYLHLQNFISTEISAGNFPTWNPFAYGGIPTLADFQGALLYPPTWLLAFLDPVMAVNWWIAGHVFLFGFLTYAWAASRGLRPAASFIAATAAMLGGAFYMHAYAGHIADIASMAWTPLVFMGIDGWLQRKHSGWIVLASAGAALQIYAGHPQYAYYTAIAALIYAIVNLVRSGPDWKKMLLGIIAIHPLAILLALAQLLPAWMELSETVHSGGTAYGYVSLFGYAPENLLTLIAPWAYGGTPEVAYWGRCYLWEMQLFLGVGMLVLAIYGIAGQNKTARLRAGIVLAALLLLALGANLPPLYKLLYHCLPLYDTFQGTSKFIYLISLFVAMLAGTGMNRLLARETRTTTAGLATLACAALLVLMGALIQSGALSFLWQSFYDTITTSQGGDVYFATNPNRTNPIFQKAALGLTGSQLWTGGLWLAAFGGLLLAVNHRKEAAHALGALAIVNLGLFAWKNTAGFEAKTAMLPPPAQLQDENPEAYKAALPPILRVIRENRTERENRGDYRTLNTVLPAANMSWRTEAIWGAGPSVLKRYAEYMFFSQGINPGLASQQLAFTSKSQMLEILRCRFAFLQGGAGEIRSVDMGSPLPRFVLTSQYKVIKNRDLNLRTVASPDFSPRQQVVLETEPNPMPENENVVWSMRVLAAGSKSLQLEVSCDRATLLVMTDTYARGWKVRPVTQMGKGVLSVQTNYDVIPANYALRAVPLAAGKHLMIMEYEQPGLETGIKLSLLATAIVAVLILVPALRRKLCFAD